MAKLYQQGFGLPFRQDDVVDYRAREAKDLSRELR